MSIAAALAVTALVGETIAEYREPKGVNVLFPQGLIKRIAMPGKTEGYMFKTVRQPILVAGKERSHLAVITNGVDDRTWPYTTILSTLLRNYCGIRDGKFAPELIKKTYAAEPVAQASTAGTDAGSKASELRRQSAVDGACKVTVVVDGSRWRKVTATFEPAE